MNGGCFSLQGKLYLMHIFPSRLPSITYTLTFISSIVWSIGTRIPIQLIITFGRIIQFNFKFIFSSILFILPQFFLIIFYFIIYHIFLLSFSFHLCKKIEYIILIIIILFLIYHIYLPFIPFHPYSFHPSKTICDIFSNLF